MLVTETTNHISASALNENSQESLPIQVLNDPSIEISLANEEMKGIFARLCQPAWADRGSIEQEALLAHSLDASINYDNVEILDDS